MPDLSAPDRSPEYDALREFVRQAFVTGTAVLLPVVVTLIVLGVVVNFVSRQLDPVVGLLAPATGAGPASEIVLKIAAFATLLAVVFLVGAWTEYRSERSGVGVFFETLVSRIPGVGSLYRSLDEMSTLLLDDDTDSFREVKLVEFPTSGSYALAFLTTDTPDVVEDAADDRGMVTVFLPMAPNPVMGGYVLHVSEDRVLDVDMSVEEGIQSIVTSGVATGERTRSELSEDMLDRFDRRLEATDLVASFEELERYAADASAKLEETARETMASGERTGDDGHARDADGDADGSERGR
ncbi:MAG: DUF502 domain-containing protein [Haloferacaceae archaeon]